MNPLSVHPRSDRIRLSAVAGTVKRRLEGADGAVMTVPESALA